MGNYRKKPVVIEAFKLGVDCIPDWFMDSVTANVVILHGSSSGFNHISDTNADIHTLEGWHHANYGDYIIRGVKGELYPCRADIFDMTYEVANKPKINADRIRGMSDTELAKFLAERFANETCNRLSEDAVVTATQIAAITHTWYCCWLDWLKQPAEVNEFES